MQTALQDLIPEIEKAIEPLREKYQEKESEEAPSLALATALQRNNFV